MIEGKRINQKLIKKYALKDGRELIIRQAAPGDASFIIEYIKTVADETDFLTFSSKEFTTGVEEEEEFIKGINKKDNCLFLVGEVDGEIVATLNFNASTRSRLRHRGELGLTVIKKYWGQGIGYLLIKILFDWIKNTGIIKKINLEVREDNTRAIKLYKRLGFTNEGKISRYFYHNGDYYSALVMGKEINKKEGKQLNIAEDKGGNTLET